MTPDHETLSRVAHYVEALAAPNPTLLARVELEPGGLVVDMRTPDVRSRRHVAWADVERAEDPFGYVKSQVDVAFSHVRAGL